MSLKIAGVIPCKGTSQRLKSKNLKKLHGIPLFLWAANNLNRVIPKRLIYIDSESDEILNIAKQKGFSTIKRPENLASNKTDGNALMFWEAKNIDADIVVQHLPPMPFLRKKTLIKAIKMVKNEFDSVFAVYKQHQYSWEGKKPNYSIDKIPNSKDLKEIEIEGMGLYVAKKSFLIKEKKRICGNFSKIEINNFEAIDIDYKSDFVFAETLAQGLSNDSEYLQGLYKFKLNEPRIIIFDIDGVMTNGGMYYLGNNNYAKKFNAKDGLAIKDMIKKNIDVRILSNGHDESSVEARAKTLGIKKVYIGREKKQNILNLWIKEDNLKTKEIAYIGDDINDLEVMNNVGLSICPNDADLSVKRKADIVLEKNGGDGCIREFWCDILNQKIKA